MRLARRLVALGVSLLALQLGVARPDASCASAPAQHDMADMAGMDHSPTDDGAKSPAPHQAVAPVCCVAVASCSIFSAGAARISYVVAPRLQPSIAPRTEQLPRSPLFAPDPPPPKTQA